MSDQNEVPRRELVDFLVQIQKTALSQKKCIKDTNFTIKKNQKEHLLFLVEILENFDSLYARISNQKDRFDRTSLKVFNSFNIIRKKISNHLESHCVHKIDLDKNELEMGLCEVVETEEVDDHKLKGKVKSVLSQGYMHSGEVLKTARVITYR